MALQKNIDVCGLGNGIVDILLRIEERDLQELKLEKATMHLVEPEFQHQILKKFQSRSPSLASGGSVGNSVVAVAQLGGRSGFMCCLGDDQYGLFYKEEFDVLGIELGVLPRVNSYNGTSLVMITPDGERTMRTALGASITLTDEHVNEDLIKRSRWLFIEGYLFSAPDTGQKAIKRAITLAKRHGCKIAITFSEAWVVDSFRKPLEEAVASADLIFANEAEAASYTGCATVEESFRRLKDLVPSAVVTAGRRGAWVRYEGQEFNVKAFPCDPVDLTGAGDVFAGSFLYGITHGIEPQHAAKGACFLAMQVITRIGARLQSGVKEYWNEALQSK